MDVIENGQLVPLARPERGETTRTHRFEEPTPGTYWRLREDFKGANNNRCRCRPMPAGTVLMLASVESADGRPHAYHFAPHPLHHDQQGPVFHAEDHALYWSPEPDGERIRQGEMLALMSDMDATRKLLTQEPPGVAPVALLGHDPTAAIGEPGRELATVDQLTSMQAYAARVQADAEARTTWITTHSTALGAQGLQLAAFHQERARAQLARAQAQIEGVEAILKTVKNLEFYTGKDIEVVLLRDGAPADPKARVTIYQEVLAFDEETLILIDQGGLDHRHVDELGEAMKDDALLKRLIPAARGVVLCRFRNTDKKFYGGDDAGSALANALMNEQAKQRHLLVRDGERVWLVVCPRLFERIEQLMPSAREQGAYFRRDRWGDTPPEQITNEDLDYASAQRRQMTALDAYGRVLILLWGLTDRETIFAGSHIPRFSNWLDEGFQHAWLQLVSQDSMLGVERPPFDQWKREHNARLTAGSWVIVRMREAFNSSYAPGAFSNPQNSRHRNQIWDPVDNLLVSRAKRDAQGLYVDVPCEYDGYSDVRNTRRTIKLYVRYDKGGYGYDKSAPGVLVLDRVHAADLTYYLESREQRRHYAEYIDLFRAARPWVEQRDAAEAGLRNELRDAVAAGGLSIDPPALEAAITEAIATARAARRDNVTPATGTAGYAAVRTAALDVLHQQVVGNEGRIHAIEAWAQQHERTPLRLALSVQDGWQLYAIAAGSELDPRLDPTPHVSRFTVAFSDDGAQIRFIERCMLRPRSGEQVVHDWNWKKHESRRTGAFIFHGDVDHGADHYLNAAPPFRLSFADAQLRIDRTLAAGAGFEELRDDRDLIHLIEKATWWSRENSSSSVRRADIVVPIGTGYGDVMGDKPFLVVACADAWGYAHRNGNVAKKVRVEAAIEGRYAHAETHIEQIGRYGDWRVGFVLIDEKFDDNASWWLGDVRIWGDDCFESEGKNRAKYRLTSLNATGARLLPRLVNVAERPA